MTLPRTPTRSLLPLALLLATLAGAAGAQTPDVPAEATPAKPRPRTPKPPKSDIPTYNPNLIVLDPAHGGVDAGATLADNALEKDATVALAGRLRTLLTAQGFTVVLTHESASDETAADQRVELANRGRPVACLLLHASNGGHGVHLYTSSLTPPPLNPYAPDPKPVVPWDTAQAASVPASLRLANDLAAALNGIRVPLVVGQASVRPMDSFTCPAVAVEIAPLNQNGEGKTPASDAGYQGRVAGSLVQALTLWRGRVLQDAAAAQAARQSATPAPAAAPAARPAPKPRPKPVIVPDEVPGDTTLPTPNPPAPVVRRPPPPAPDVPPNGDAR